MQHNEPAQSFPDFEALIVKIYPGIIAKQCGIYPDLGFISAGKSCCRKMQKGIPIVSESFIQFECLNNQLILQNFYPNKNDTYICKFQFVHC